MSTTSHVINEQLYPADKIDVNAIPLPPPQRPHQQLHQDELRNRLIVVGDVHGCLEELKDLLEKAHYDVSTTSVLLLGDLVNKGPFSAQVIQFARSIGAFCIRGNHDDYVLKYALGLVPQRTPDHLAYLSLLTREDIEWLKELPYSIFIPTWKKLFVHAGLVPGHSLHEQSFDDLVTLRNLLADSETGCWLATSKGKTGSAWAKVWDGHIDGMEGVTVYFGHDAKRGLQKESFAVGLDTGCAYGKKLTAIILPTEELIEVPARAVYQAIVDKD
eukprot:gene720-780_t